MRDQNGLFGPVSRRTFLGTAASTAVASTLPLAFSSSFLPSAQAAALAKPNSKFNGVQIGVITYSFRNLEPGIEGVLKACVESGCSSIELMSNGIEDWCGAPKAPARAQGAAPGGAPGAARGAIPADAPGAARGAVAPAGVPGAAREGAPAGAAAAAAPRGRQALTPEQQAAQDKYTADLKAWRLAAPINKFTELRKMFNDSGINIHIVKWSPARWSDEEIDYAFKTAKIMGANIVSEELGLDAAKKLGPIAEKHGMIIGLHTHMQFATPGFENDVLKPALAVSRAVQLNFDTGHFAGSTGRHPNEIIDQYKDRICSLHLKDKTGPKTTPPNQNQVWGQGETPIEDVLLKVKNERLPYPCDIELEYPVPAWSTSVKEVRTCMKYARQILL
jgi:sugar phosphate isomerase/epimerase